MDWATSGLETYSRPAYRIFQGQDGVMKSLHSQAAFGVQTKGNLYFGVEVENILSIS